MSQTDLILLIVIGAVAAIAVLWLFMRASADSERASRRIPGQAAHWQPITPQQPQGLVGSTVPWSQYKQPCPPGAQPGCVPAKLVEPADEYIAIRVRAGSCGCSAGEIGEQLQMIADMTQAARDTKNRSQLEANLLEMLGGKRSSSSSK